jgi:hypothetical protein
MRHKLLTWLKVIGILLALILAAVQLWDWYNAPSEKLVAHVQFGAFMLPPQLDDEFQKLSRLVDFDTLSERFGIPELLRERGDSNCAALADELVLRAYSMLSHELPTSLPYQYKMMNGLWLVRVRNEGGRSVTGVSIRLPYTQSVLLKKEGQPPRYNTSGEVIELGDLRPTEEITLVAWADIEPSLYSSNDIKLIHSNGVGSVSVSAPVEGATLWIYEHLTSITLLVLMVMCVALILVLQIGLHDGDGNKPAGDSANSSKSGD